MTKSNGVPLVSIVVPVYNNEKYIKYCVESLVNQKYPASSMEILLVNDGSTDDSLAVCYKMEKSYSQVKVLNKENGGVSDTRNLGMKEATGKYIMLLDSDDYLSHGTIKHLVTFFEKHYDEIDLVTYPIHWYYEDKDRFKKHPRYKSYTKGTGVYNLDEFPQVNQSTVNIMIKNDKMNPPLYNTSMKLSEDQFFNTEILMKKNKIGFVKHAVYFYRRHGGGVSQTRNNPYYCFEDIISYNELLIERYQKDGKVPLYIQYLVGNTIKWRVGSNELFPYHYSGKKYDEAIERIVTLLSHIDDQVIMDLEACDVHRKIYLLKLKKRELELTLKDQSYTIYTKEGQLVEESEYVECVLTRIKQADNQCMYMNAYLKSALPLLNDHIKVILVMKLRNGSIVEEERPLQCSSYSYTPAGLKFANFLNFDATIDMKQVKKLDILVEVENKRYPIKYIFIRPSRFQISNYRYHIYLDKYRLRIDKSQRRKLTITRKNILLSIYDTMMNCLRYGSRNPKVLYFRWLSKTERKIWLYVDSNGVIDNSYHQFKHDVLKNDGIERYYVYDGSKSFYDDKFTDFEKQYLVKHKSKLHKELFMKSDKIFVSFSSLSIYQPFKNIRKYQDILHYDLIYLQHGILHANLLRMYSKESTEIDKFVISSHFEKNNLMGRYNYNESDLICSSMPRMAIQKENIEVQNKILFAPSWRKYLIGELINNRRELKEDEFINSRFFKEIYTFLHSESLNKLLEKKDLVLDFKLHPIFKGYKELFELKDNSRIRISFDKTILGEYKLFITDFSSFQFDYVGYQRPIVYFLPDEVEFRAGLHTYSELDLKYEDAFGKLCTTGQQLIETMSKYIENDFDVEDIYKQRMSEFFFECDDPCEEIYQTLTHKKGCNE